LVDRSHNLTDLAFYSGFAQNCHKHHANVGVDKFETLTDFFT